MSRPERKKIEDAERSYRKMWKEIEPFVKKRKIKPVSTIGEWGVSSCE